MGLIYFTSEELMERWQVNPHDLLILMDGFNLEYLADNAFGGRIFNPTTVIQPSTRNLKDIYFSRTTVEAFEKEHPELKPEHKPSSIAKKKLKRAPKKKVTQEERELEAELNQFWEFFKKSGYRQNALLRAVNETGKLEPRFIKHWMLKDKSPYRNAETSNGKRDFINAFKKMVKVEQMKNSQEKQ